MLSRKKRISSGINQLDRLLGSLYIGDNVVWHDEAGSLAFMFCYHFIQESVSQKKPTIYVSFDRSPKNLLDKLADLAENQHLTILDCFTNGKGDGSEVFAKFYEKDGAQWPYQVIKVNEPSSPDQVSEAIYGLQQTMAGNVRFIFESLTGMQDLWGGEEQVMKFYSHSCPKLYELDTIAYWIMEKNAHSEQLKAYINQIAQVAVDLAVNKSNYRLTILKAEKRNLETINRPYSFGCDGLSVNFDTNKFMESRIDIGKKIKQLRLKQGISQKDLASLVGVTPSTISQVESNAIYPSLPALFKIAEILSVDVGAFFYQSKEHSRKVVFNSEDAVEISFKDMPKDSIKGTLLTPVDLETKVEPYLIEIGPSKTLPHHFFVHKGEEMGFLIKGCMQMNLPSRQYELNSGDVVFLRDDVPLQWKNQGKDTARLLWLKIK